MMVTFDCAMCMVCVNSCKNQDCKFEITNIEFLEVKSVEIENLLSTRKEISEINY